MDDQILNLLALVRERKDVIKGSLSPKLTGKMKKQSWNEIVSLINKSHPMVVRTKAECEKRWYTVLSKAKERISQ